MPQSRRLIRSLPQLASWRKMLTSLSKKSSLTFSTTVGQNKVSANLTNSLAPFRIFLGHGLVRSASLEPSARQSAGKTQKEPAEFGGTSLCRTQPVFQRAVTRLLRLHPAPSQPRPLPQIAWASPFRHRGTPHLSTGCYRRLLCALVLLAAVQAAVASAGQTPGTQDAPSWNLQIVFSNDLHGKTEPCG